MLRFIIIGIVQSLFLTLGQVFLKLSINKMDSIELSFNNVKNFVSLSLLTSGVSFMVAAGLWLYMLKYYDFSLAYPITGISYIFGMFASAMILNESIPMTRWIGVIFIVVGVLFMMKH